MEKWIKIKDYNDGTTIYQPIDRLLMITKYKDNDYCLFFKGHKTFHICDPRNIKLIKKFLKERGC